MDKNDFVFDKLKNSPREFKSIDEAIGEYVALRDELSANRKIWNAKENQYKSDLEKISMWLRDKADELGVDSFNSRQFGTAFRSVKTSYRVGAWDKFIQWCINNDATHCLEKRCAKNAVKEIHDESGEIPPGLEFHCEVEFDVRRPSKS